MIPRGLPHDLAFGERETALRVAFLTLLGLLLRFVWYDSQPLWTDEAITWEFARADWPGLLFRQLYDASPPASYLAWKVWSAAVPGGPELRWLPALFGALTVPLAYLLGARAFHRPAGVLAALLVAVNPLHLYYSNELRYPTLLTFLLTAQGLVFLALLRSDRWWKWALWVLLTAAALWTQYFTGFVVAAQWLYALGFRRERRLLERLTAATLAALLLFAPWWPEFALQLARGKPSREFFSPLAQLLLGPAFLVLGGSEWSLPSLGRTTPAQPGHLLLALLAAAPFLAATALGARAERRTPTRFALTSALLATFGLFFAAAQFLPLFRPKYLLPLLPPAAVLAGAGLVQLQTARRWTAWALLAAILGVSLHGVAALQRDPLLQKERWDLVAQTIERYAEPGDAVAAPNDYYALAGWLALGKRRPIEAVVCRTPHEQLADERQVRAAAKRLFATHRRVWYIDHDRHLFDPRELVPAVFAAEGVEVTRRSFPTTARFSLRLYAADESAARASYAGVVDFQTGDFVPAQAARGFAPGPPGFRWMAAEAEAVVARRWREDVAFACCYVHAPYFTAGPPALTLWAENEPLRTVRVTASDLVCLEGALPPRSAARTNVGLRLTADRVFTPDEVLGDGDRTPRSVLVQRMGVTRSGWGWEAP